MTPEGTFVDDLLVYRLADDHFLLVVNAANIAKDFAWIAAQIAGIGDAVAVNTSSRYALLAVQGPAARDVLQPLTGVDLGGHQVLLVRARRGRRRPRDGLAHRLHRRRRLRDLRAAGIGRARVGRDARSRGGRRRRSRRPRRARHAAARGGDAPLRQRHRRHDDRARSRISGWIVGWKKDDFIGADVLRRQKAEGVARKLVGFEMIDRAIARHGYDVYVDGAEGRRRSRAARRRRF